MAFIRRVQSLEQVPLDAEHLVGRAAGCMLQLSDSHVSSRHAVFRWHEERWSIRDLGSRNGTFLDGRRMIPGMTEHLSVGARLGFGNELDLWELADDARPCIMALPVRGGDPIYADDSAILGVPSASEPLLTIYRAADGLWRLEPAEQSASVLAHGETFDVAGETWRFTCPPQVSPSITEERASREREPVLLIFSVSSDEEHVQLTAQFGDHRVDLGTRNHNYLLLQLARRRIADQADGHAPTAAGWYYLEELSKHLRIEPNQLNLDVFRIRRHLEAKGIPYAVDLIERRAMTRQLRIGTDRLQVVVI